MAISPWLSRTLAVASLLGATACGDIGNMRVALDFDDEEVEGRVRAVMFVVREVPPSGNGCALLWSNQPTGLAENRSVLEYPNRTDIVAAPVKLSMYPKLTFLAYAYPTRDVTASEPIAGGCVDADVEPDVTSEVRIALEKAP